MTLTRTLDSEATPYGSRAWLAATIVADDEWPVGASTGVDLWLYLHEHTTPAVMALFEECWREFAALTPEAEPNVNVDIVERAKNPERYFEACLADIGTDIRYLVKEMSDHVGASSRPAIVQQLRPRVLAMLAAQSEGRP